MGLGLRIRELRVERGWTQNELAKRSGLDRGYISNLELNVVAKPSATVFLALSRAFNIRPEELYQAAGYIKEAKISYNETPDEILDKLKLAMPEAIPVYDVFPIRAGDSLIEPVDYVYRIPSKPAQRELSAHIIRGSCLEPEIKDSDIVVIDKEAQIDIGDTIVALVSGNLAIGRLKKIADELWLENNRGRVKMEDCQAASVVIEVIRRLK